MTLSSRGIALATAALQVAAANRAARPQTSTSARLVAAQDRSKAAPQRATRKAR